MRRGINILWIALIYCGTVFGAGFASGQEIFQFFSGHGFWGIVSSAFVGFLFSFLGGVVCARAKRLSCQNAGEYISCLFPGKIAPVLTALSTVFLAVTFCIMIAGCGTLAQELLHLRPIAGAALSAMLCFFVIRNRVRGLATLNTVITPFLFSGVLFFCLFLLKNGTPSPEPALKGDFCSASWSGILYLSYNMISALAVLVSSARLAENEKEAAAGGILGGIFVAVPLFLMTLCLTWFPEENAEQLPFFALVCSREALAAPFCALLLFGAMLTTAASSGVSVLAEAPASCSAVLAFLLCALAVLVSVVPFDVLVKTMYTSFGVCGLILVVGVLKSIWRK